MDKGHVYASIRGIDNSISTSQSRLVDGLAEIKRILYEDQVTRLGDHLKMLQYAQRIQGTVKDNAQTLGSISERLTAIERKLDKIFTQLSQN